MSTEINGDDGELPAGRVAIIASRYNRAICDALVQGARDTLTAAGFDSQAIAVIRVSGAWELPLVARSMLDRSDVIAVIALGAVIRGETTHDEHINRAVSLALMNLGLETRRPVGFGLLTCNSLEQAIQRSGGTVGNKGVEAAEAVVETLRLIDKLS